MSEREPLGKPVLLGWMAAIAATVLYCAIYGLLNLGAPATEYFPAGPGIAGLPTLIGGLLLVVPIAGIFALPSVTLFWGLLLLAQRTPLGLHKLPAWLAVGLIAAAPTAWLDWHVDTITEGLDNPDPQPPYAWVNLEFPLFLLVCGLIAGFFAWRARARLAA